MERKYEVTAQAVQGVIASYEADVKEAEDAANKVMADWRFSASGKENAKQNLYKELQERADKYMNLIREAAKDFCDTYRIKLPSDNKDHSMDIANALKMIDMLGYNLTAETLKTVLEPIKNSYKHMKMIADVLEAKNKGITADFVHYDPAVITTMYEWLGVNTKVFEYLDAFREVEEICTTERIKLYAATNSYGNASLVSLTPQIPYEIFALPDAMIRAGKMYAELESEFSELFKVHTPTDTEMIESIVKN